MVAGWRSKSHASTLRRTPNAIWGHSGYPRAQTPTVPRSPRLPAGKAMDEKTLREDYGLSKHEIDDAVAYEAEVAELAA